TQSAFLRNPLLLDYRWGTATGLFSRNTESPLYRVARRSRILARDRVNDGCCRSHAGAPRTHSSRLEDSRFQRRSAFRRRRGSDGFPSVAVVSGLPRRNLTTETTRARRCTRRIEIGRIPSWSKRRIL